MQMRALLVIALLACSPVVGRAGTPNAWSAIALSGECPGKRGRHGTAFEGGLIYVFGGDSSSDYTDRLISIDPATGACTRLDSDAGMTGTPPATPRTGMGMTSLDGVLYLFGGSVQHSTSGESTNELHAYNIASRAWRQLDGAAGVSGDPPGARTYMGFSAGAGGLVR